MVQDVLANADVLLRTDCRGAVVSFTGDHEVGDPTELAAELDLALAAIQQVGSRHFAGALEATLLMFRGRLVAVAEEPRGGRVALLASVGVRPGLLLSQVRRLVADVAPPPLGANP